MGYWNVNLVKCFMSVYTSSNNIPDPEDRVLHVLRHKLSVRRLERDLFLSFDFFGLEK